MYWQCPRCWSVVYQFPPDPEERFCEVCRAKPDWVYSWSGHAAFVYHAALHNLGKGRDWTSVALRATLLCSLFDVHESRLIWSVMAKAGCPEQVAHSVSKEVRRQTYDKLFRAIVGETRARLQESTGYGDFWSAARAIRDFRNRFVHGEPEQREKEMKAVAPELRQPLRTALVETEPAFAAITNASLAKIAEGDS